MLFLFFQWYGRYPEKLEIKEFPFLYDNIKEDPEFLNSVKKYTSHLKS